jgi:hypothetical protein
MEEKTSNEQSPNMLLFRQSQDSHFWGKRRA